MVKTVILREDAYKAIINKRTELINKDKEMNLQDIVADAILAGIDVVGEE